MAANTPAPLKSLSAIVEEYDEKLAEIPERLADLRAAEKAIEMGATIGGTFTHSIWGGRQGTSSVTQRNLEEALLRSAWRHVYDGLNIAKIAPASDRAKYERELESPPPFTIDNIRANFGTYLLSPREHILRGLAEVFSSLDPAFKSHSKVKVGVKALPKRVILSGFGDYSWGSYGQEKLRDTLNAVASLEARPLVNNSDISDLKEKTRRDGEAEWWGGKLRVFQNGNAHLFFSPDALDAVNKGLAEYYGDVLPDAPDENAKHKPGTDVARDLQFYPTPDRIADKMVQKAFPRDGMRILEPSCGDGAILRAISRFAMEGRVKNLRAHGYEIDATRAACARQAGFSVTRDNFLDVPPQPVFDMVLMNPPFYGKHYQKHVEHARRFLKPDGVLYAILPVTAATDHAFVKLGRMGRDAWEDLPVGSFAASGTRINTGIARFFAYGKD